MSKAVPNSATSGQIKPLSAGDLEAVIAIDTALAGVSRRGFFEKRLAAVIKNPGDYVCLGLHDGDRLTGYVFAKLFSGEFGKPGGRASLDAIGVDRVHQNSGGGHALLQAVEETLNQKGAVELASQVSWDDSALISFLGKAGFVLAPRLILMRHTNELLTQHIPGNFSDLDEPVEIDHSSPDRDEFEALSRDKVPVRSMTEADLNALIAIDRKNSGIDRSTYYKRKQHEVLYESGVRISLVAERDGFPVGFIMARVDFGEFGRTDTEAVMDTIAVDPNYHALGVGHALMSQLITNLSVLRTDHVRTELDWNDVNLITYLDACGFVPAQKIVFHRKYPI